jgi:hypothetical protein
VARSTTTGADDLPLDLDALADRIAARMRADGDRLLDLDALADRLLLSPRGVRGLIARGELPQGFLIGGVRRWAWDAVRQHLNAQQQRRPRHRRRGQYERRRSPTSADGEGVSA